MKKISYFVVFFFIMFSCLIYVSAKEVAVIDGYDVRFRTSMDTSNTNNIIASYNMGVELDLLDSKAGSNNACSKWYKVRNSSNQIGYICGEFAIIKTVKDEEVINPDDYKEYSDYLKELGFPDSYITSIIKLHNKYPLWQFKAYKVNMDFDKLVNLEYNGYSEGWSLFEDTGRYFDGYKATDSWAYNYLTDIFRSNYEGGGINRWYAPNKKTIEYYLDPRNFLNERQIFMFETLSYNSVYHTKEGIEAMLKGTFMTGNADDKHTFIDAFTDAAKEHNVSPYVLISRVIQEVGASGSTIVSGTVKDYNGYYNFYNIEAYGNSNEETIANGLKYAKKMGWDTKYKAIVGGAAFLADSYINVGQDTLYSQKWDIVGPDYVNHQYMQNIEAPASESIKTYNGYNNIKLLNSNFMFVIPVYNTIPDKTNLPDRGNPNNYLSKLKINDTVVIDKSSTKTTYDVNLSYDTNILNITGEPVNNKAKINGLGTKNFTTDNEVLKLSVTAENGDIREYTINIARSADITSKKIEEILDELKIRHDDKYLYGFNLGTDITKIINDIKVKDNRLIVEYLDKDNKVKTSGIVSSGDTIKINNNGEEKSYKIIIYGDVNGDGKIVATDYVLIKNHIMDIKKLTEFELLCADINHDGKVLATDYVAIKNHIMEVKSITQ